MIRLRLYVTGRTVSAERARLALRELERRLMGGEASVVTEVVDVLENPEAASADNIFATPTLVRLSPGPQARLFGDLNSIDKVISGLKLDTPPLPLAATA